MSALKGNRLSDWSISILVLPLFSASLCIGKNGDRNHAHDVTVRADTNKARVDYVSIIARKKRGVMTKDMSTAGAEDGDISQA